jgi:hypothetical protein
MDAAVSRNNSRRRQSQLRSRIPRAPVLVRDVSDMLDPPRLPTSFLVPLVIRYQKTSASVASVYWRALANLLIVSVSTTSGYVIYAQFKCRKVCCYGLASAASAATGYSTPPVRLTMYGVPTTDGATSPIQNRRTKEDVSTNDHGCMVSLPFPDPTNWYDVFGIVNMTNSPPSFAVEGPIGTVVDVYLVLDIFGASRSTLPKTSTTTAATSQVPYFNLLDNTNATGAAGSSFLTPISCVPANVNANVWL